eukprot:TRINITY_DN50364_c0_g1_i1.p3 TRINITY_DN50364_c0_g1~~TRINITY_DN50364_c0_g1_i1.p3  ORF type:complete len:113 (+),score=12.80 TRINITY_DN50364_c0_g1_i1:481-819(+)
MTYLLKQLLNLYLVILCLDAVDFDCCILLSVAPEVSVTLAASEFKNKNFFPLALLQNVAFDNGVFNGRLTQGDLFSVGKHQDIVEFNFPAFRTFNLLNPEGISLLNPPCTLR